MNTAAQKAKAAARERRWRERHPDRAKASRQRWEASHKTERREAHRLWYAKNRAHARERNQAWYAANRERAAAQIREAHLWRRYGLTGAQRAALLAKQGGLCSICGVSIQIGSHVDHDHATGAVRGLLCGSCNRGLGAFRDLEEHLAAAIDYLRRCRAPRLVTAMED
jgi:hypothetical protein